MRTTVLAATLLVLLATGGCLESLVGGPDVSPKDFVQSKEYRRWVIEVDAQSGAEPSDELLAFLKGRLAANVAKPDGIVFERGAGVPGSGRSWTTSAITDAAESTKDRDTSGSTVTLHLLFLRGGTSDDSGSSRVLGVTIGWDLIAIFPDNIASACEASLLGLGCNTDPITRATTLHEFGHAIGLVNRGTPMVHPHEATTCNGQKDSAHSSNQQSVMYCAVETNQVAILFGNEPPQDFDADDKADLKAMREK